MEVCSGEASPCGVGQQLGAFAPGENRLGRRFGSTLNQRSAIFRCQDSFYGVPPKRRCTGCRETVWIIHQIPLPPTKSTLLCVKKITLFVTSFYFYLQTQSLSIKNDTTWIIKAGIALYDALHELKLVILTKTWPFKSDAAFLRHGYR